MSADGDLIVFGGRVHVALDSVTPLVRALVDRVRFDDSGVDGRGGNGGLLSRETLRAADNLRIWLMRMDTASARHDGGGDAAGEGGR